MPSGTGECVSRSAPFASDTADADSTSLGVDTAEKGPKQKFAYIALNTAQHHERVDRERLRLKLNNFLKANSYKPA